MLGRTQNEASVVGWWSVRWQGGTMYKNGSTVASLIGGLERDHRRERARG